LFFIDKGVPRGRYLGVFEITVNILGILDEVGKNVHFSLEI
jgi:hypothetical protein